MADFHLGGSIVELVESGFHGLIAENSAYAERVLRQNGNDLLQRHDFKIPLSAGMLFARKMTLIRDARPAKRRPIHQIDLDDARMELGDFRQIHAVRPDRFHGCVDDDPLAGSKQW